MLRMEKAAFLWEQHEFLEEADCFPVESLVTPTLLSKWDEEYLGKEKMAEEAERQRNFMKRFLLAGGSKGPTP